MNTEAKCIISCLGRHMACMADALAVTDQAERCAPLVSITQHYSDLMQLRIKSLSAAMYQTAHDAMH